ncbi:hypothetical protein [Nocardiopsis dassonvillei]|uniref:hypothetical protein n=1 Tax=Nocardiopsis dassonvillei TaxID=2014 RepID=UPI003670DBBB
MAEQLYGLSGAHLSGVDLVRDRGRQGRLVRAAGYQFHRTPQHLKGALLVVQHDNSLRVGGSMEHNLIRNK